MSEGKKKTIVLFLLIFFMPSPNVHATKVAPSDEVQMCLDCHSNKEMSKQLQNKETLPLYVNGEEFISSVHNDVDCSGCHLDISIEKHPEEKSIESRKKYAADASNICRSCHVDQGLKKKLMHNERKLPPCVECHGSHSIKRMAEWKAGIGEGQYCLTCHRHDLSMTIKGSESLNPYVDESSIANSVHRNLRCRHCHSGFSMSEHPARAFKSKREYSIATGDICGSCHPGARKQYEGSIHLALLKEGNLKAPLCIDCHGSHSVGNATANKDLGLQSCKCHGEIYGAYKSSVHGAAWDRGDRDAPICSSCHEAHRVESMAILTMRIEAGKACLTCHKEARLAHESWISRSPVLVSSSAGIRHDTVACSLCHSPGAKGRIYLGLFDKKRGTPFLEEEVLSLLRDDSSGSTGEMDPYLTSVSSSGLRNMMKHFKRKGAEVAFLGQFGVQNGIEAHLIAGKNMTVRGCEKCHRPDSDFYDDATVLIPRADGRPTFLRVSNQVLTSLLPVSPLFVFGGPRIPLLDLTAIIVVLGGLAFPLGHIAIRMITSPLRRARRKGKGTGE